MSSEPGYYDYSIPVALIPVTGAVMGTPGYFTPVGGNAPTNVAALIAGTPKTVTPSPTANWGAGTYVQTDVAGVAGQAHWNGTTWVTGVHP